MVMSSGIVQFPNHVDKVGALKSLSKKLHTSKINKKENGYLFTIFYSWSTHVLESQKVHLNWESICWSCPILTDHRESDWLPRSESQLYYTWVMNTKKHAAIPRTSLSKISQFPSILAAQPLALPIWLKQVRPLVTPKQNSSYSCRLHKSVTPREWCLHYLSEVCQNYPTYPTESKSQLKFFTLTFFRNYWNSLNSNPRT